MTGVVGEPIDWRHYFNVINRRKWAIVGLAATVGLLTTLVVFAMTPIYRASATLLIESQEANVVSIEEVYGVDTRSQTYYETQFEILRSRPLAERVVDRLALLEQPQFMPRDEAGWRSWLPSALADQPSRSQPDPRGVAVDQYTGRLSIEPVRNTQLVYVRFESPDPALAAKVATEHATVFIESMLDARVAVTESAAKWMSERLEGMQHELRASEARLQEYREQEQLIDVNGLRALPSQEINDLSTQLLEVRQARSAAEIAHRQITAAERESDDLQGVPAILDDEGIARFQAVQAQAQQAVAELEKRYGPMHPRLIAAQSELARATENLNNQTRSVTEGIRNRYEAARSEEATIEAALDRARQQYQDVGRKESELNNLQRVVDTNRQLYELFYNRLSETAATGDLVTAQARIVAPAVVPRTAARPNKGWIVFIATLLTVLFGVGIAFLIESLDNTVRNSADIEEQLKRPTLGMLPLLKGKALAAVGAIRNDEIDPRFGEAIRTVRTAISLDNLDKPHKIILVTSAVGHEGKSTFALNLAVAFAQSEKTLLLDADLRRPAIGKMLGLPRDTPGLSELLLDRARLMQCLTPLSGSGLVAMSTGFIPPDPLQLLSSGRMAKALKVLSNAYTRVIIDSPPILPVSDAAVLSKYADSVVFVVKADSTTVAQIKNGLGLLARVNAPITGIVLNQFDHRKQSDYGYASSYEPYAAKSRVA